MIIYQVYPRSFLDTNGDGIGDLAGITEKLPYIARLGVDAVWISPFVASPQKDFGYDVSDYCAVDPLFGTLADFKKLTARAHALGLKIIMDQVWCHCSSRHLWFKESRQSRDNPKADWFIWRESKKDGTVPNNWLSYFGGSAWTWETGRQQYYFHQFLTSQPTFNLRNKAVRKALLDVGRFWLELGVDGFRLDALHTGFADPKFRDNPARPKTMPPEPDVPVDIPQARQIRHFSEGHKDTLGFLEEIRRVANRYDAWLLGEVSGENGYARAAQYTKGQRLHSAYSFGLLKGRPDAKRFNETVVFAEKAKSKSHLTYSQSNHDVVRVASRWKDPKLALLFGLTLPGHYCLYQGEELGLPESNVPHEKMVDPFGLAFYPKFKGRDGARTPMPWKGKAKNGGFSNTPPWLPFERAHARLAVDAQEKDKNSTLLFARALVSWCKMQPALEADGFRALPSRGGLIAFERYGGGQTLRIFFNLGSRPLLVALEGRVVYKVKAKQKGQKIILPPMSGILLETQRRLP
jgi:alpha-glucosidase